MLIQSSVENSWKQLDSVPRYINWLFYIVCKIIGVIEHCVWELGSKFCPDSETNATPWSDPFWSSGSAVPSVASCPSHGAWLCCQMAHQQASSGQVLRGPVKLQMDLLSQQAQECVVWYTWRWALGSLVGCGLQVWESESWVGAHCAGASLQLRVLSQKQAWIQYAILIQSSV